jgi:hypothetical protein
VIDVIPGRAPLGADPESSIVAGLWIPGPCEVARPGMTMVGGAPGDGYDDYGNRADGLRGEFRSYRSRDVWGHWGAYYGPVIPMI